MDDDEFADTTLAVQTIQFPSKKPIKQDLSDWVTPKKRRNVVKSVPMAPNRVRDFQAKLTKVQVSKIQMEDDKVLDELNKST